LVAAVFLGLLAATGSVEARDARALESRDLAARSAYVVLAECTGVEVAPVDRLGGNLFTFSHFRVETNIAGDLEPEFTLRLFGGLRGNVWIDAPVMPRFRVGERVLLLLREKNADGYPVVSTRGVFRVRADARGGAGTLEIPIAAFAGADERGLASRPGQFAEVGVEDFIRSLSTARPTAASSTGRPEDR
jgi:hypothetical protein